jgi:hypothetical protein
VFSRLPCSAENQGGREIRITAPSGEQRACRRWSTRRPQTRATLGAFRTPNQGCFSLESGIRSAPAQLGNRRSRFGLRICSLPEGGQARELEYATSALGFSSGVETTVLGFGSDFICNFLGAFYILGQARAEGKGELATCHHRTDSRQETGRLYFALIYIGLVRTMTKQKKKELTSVIPSPISAHSLASTHFFSLASKHLPSITN